MSEPIIRVENLGKKYQIRHQEAGPRYRALRDVLADGVKSGFGLFNRHRKSSTTREEFWALQDVNFEVNEGEVVGIIGRNGAGKSTLLKILSRITEPTTGRITLNGRVASLLEVGTGFHPELTGRENIYLNGAILGMSQSEIARKFDEIVDFSGVEKFLDTPVKRYSSGMYVRLAFAVAAHLEPEILVIDEVLAVGDAEFQKKCLGKMGEVARGGRTVLFVSHNMAVMQNLCASGVLLGDGQVIQSGPIHDVVSGYLLSLNAKNDCEVDLSSHKGRISNALPIIRSVRLYSDDDIGTVIFSSGATMGIEIHIDPLDIPLHAPEIGVGVNDQYGNRLFTVGTYFSECGLADITCLTTIRCEIQDLPLAPGGYTLTLAAGPQTEPTRDWLHHAVAFSVTEADYFGSGKLPRPGQGSLLVRGQWSMKLNPLTTVSESIR
ncbi:ATP-binding cassette domain-containing protein [bacterium]|nr:ATP-binding cassette domain-containing protein [bacterium]